MIRVIMGPPGTGKTTTLLDLLDDHLARGISPESIGFISFTRKAVNEARDRAIDRFAFPVSSFKYFRTIHSLAFRQLGITRDEVVQKEHLQELGEIAGVEIKGTSSSLMVYEMTEDGDQLLFLDGLARATKRPLRQVWEESGVDLSYFQAEQFQQTYKKYRETNALTDYSDMLERYEIEGIVPDLDVLFVDEAQDLSPIQWRIVERLIGSSKDTYIAGDDDQAVFKWSGADVSYFIELGKQHSTTVLDQSYRIPSQVHDLAVQLSARIKNRYPKEFRARDEEGLVESCFSLESVEMDSGDWLVLVRNGYQIRQVIELCRLSGYPYRTAFESTNESDFIRGAIAWENLRKGRNTAVKELRIMADLVVDLAPDRVERTIRGRSDSEIVGPAILEGLGLQEKASQAWHDVLNKISIYDRTYLLSCRRRGEKVLQDPRIHVSTIHGAKGGERDNVALCLDMSYRTFSGYMDGPGYDDEVRVYYVGATRAKNRLSIVEPQTRYYFQELN